MLVGFSEQGVPCGLSGVVSASLVLPEFGEEACGLSSESASIRAQRGCGLFLSLAYCQLTSHS